LQLHKKNKLTLLAYIDMPRLLIMTQRALGSMVFISMTQEWQAILHLMHPSLQLKRRNVRKNDKNRFFLFYPIVNITNAQALILFQKSNSIVAKIEMTALRKMALRNLRTEALRKEHTNKFTNGFFKVLPSTLQELFIIHY
jgi:hypothetical protein